MSMNIAEKRRKVDLLNVTSRTKFSNDDGNKYSVNVVVGVVVVVVVAT